MFGKTLSRHKRLVYLSLTLLLIVPLMSGRVYAQDSTPTPPAPVREADRRAPDREPVILEQIDNGTEVQTTIQLPITADTYIASERPNQNFGSDSLFLGYNLAGTNNYGAQRLLLRFDTTVIPETAVVTDAYFRLYLTLSSPQNDEPMGTVLRRLASSWNEFTVTWNSEPTWTPIDDVTYVGNSIGWYYWQVEEVVQTWVEGTAENYGFEIIGDETVQQRERAFYSSETLTDFYPQLIVEYTTSADTTAPDITVEPIPEYVGRSFDVTWSGEDTGGSGIAYFDVQYRVDGDQWLTWLAQTTATSAAFDNAENGRLYEFRARGVDQAGNVEPFGPPEAAAVVDNQPPTTTIDPLPPLINTNSFDVSWSGDDGENGAGVQYYDVGYRLNHGAWVLWQSQTVDTEVTFVAAADGLYEFEARAVDNRGQTEMFTGAVQAAVVVDAAPPFVQPSTYLPYIGR